MKRWWHIGRPEHSGWRWVYLAGGVILAFAATGVLVVGFVAAMGER